LEKDARAKGFTLSEEDLKTYRDLSVVFPCTVAEYLLSDEELAKSKRTRKQFRSDKISRRSNTKPRRRKMPELQLRIASRLPRERWKRFETRRSL
jgi:hypothetical protein